MGINLLLDTCILKNLVSKTEFSYYLKELAFWVKNKHLRLLAPEILKTEWKKHRKEEEGKILKNIKELEKDLRKLRMLKEDSAQFQQEQIEDLRRELISQLEVIDELLINYGTNIETTDQIKILLYQQRLDNKNPFGTSTKDNTNDATIIFTSLDYLKKNNETQLYFVSNNSNEFAHGSKPNLEVHPDITIFTQL